MKWVLEVFVFSMFVAWNVLLGFITYRVWSTGRFVAVEPAGWIINGELVMATLFLIASIILWLWKVFLDR